ncbi:KPN_02809 family neutral zinc metallopeptidase [Frigidibacter oleivorans]|uniref:KPN_02809 family neutral zinc metallopeptidase n=1 Tax=Frigidibacter oleivorans TaxID=2487129 RepID=UPI000F8F0250|nr:neutral zinc metallopeptidase [Frigidibacter oleivorans]
MRWQGRRGSRNIDDRRGQRMGGGAVQVGGVGMIAIVAIYLFFGVDLTPILSGDPGPAPRDSAALSEEDRQMGEFVSVTLADTEEVWQDIFAQMGRSYDPATLVLFSGVTQSACGGASGATGPFYCPTDGRVYLDTDFFGTLARDLGASGDFAAAYVVAHEVAHHVQDELGILSEVNAMRARASAAQSNALSVRIELQADCFSGVFARHAEAQFGSIEPGDIAEAMNAAARIGDDRLQRQAGRVPVPDSFTHGTSAQRQDWFGRGYRNGDPSDCDTFAAETL